jgi:hypothetical protein
MSSLETFWAVAGGAAPVIALAAVVALPDLQSAIETYFKVNHPFDPKTRTPVLPATGLQTTLWSDRIRFYALMANVVLQAAVLGVAMASLAYRFSVVSPVVVIAAEVAGVLALALTVYWISRARSIMANWPQASEDSGWS